MASLADSAPLGPKSSRCRALVELVSRDEERAAAAQAREQSRLDDCAKSDTAEGGEDGRSRFEYCVRNLAQLRTKALSRLKGLGSSTSPAARAALVETWERGLDFLDSRTLTCTSRNDTENEETLTVFAVASSKGVTTTFHHRGTILQGDGAPTTTWDNITAHVITDKTWNHCFDQIIGARGGGGGDANDDLLAIGLHACLCDNDDLTPTPPPHSEAFQLATGRDMIFDAQQGRSDAYSPRHYLDSDYAEPVPPLAPATADRLFQALGLDHSLVTTDDLLQALLVTFGLA